MIEALEGNVGVLGTPALMERAPPDQSACIHTHKLQMRNRNTVFDAVHRRIDTLHC